MAAFRSGGLNRLLQAIQQTSRTCSCSSAATFHSSSLASDKQFLSWAPESAKRVTTPLTQALPGLQTTTFEAPPAEQLTETTTLPNGARIVTENASGPTASLGIYVDSGSIYEDESTTGCSSVLEMMAFKATHNRSSLQLLGEVEKLGSTINANAAREQMAYTVDCLRTAVPQALEVLCDAVLNAALLEEEVAEVAQRVALLLASPDAQPVLLTEALLQRCYTGALGRPLIPTPEALHRITPDLLRGFAATNYTAPRVVLAAANVDHRLLVDLAAPMLSALPAAPPPPPEPASQYVGGHVHLPGEAPLANLILGFEYLGGWRDVEGAVAMTVLTYLLGGGSSFSSGGPGKGMHSRLYTRVLNYYGSVHSCQAFSNTFLGSGVVGIQAQCDPSDASQMLDVMCRELEAVASPVAAIEVQRAQRAAISLIHNALESKATSAEDIGRQILTYGHRISGKEYVQMIEALTPADIAAFVQRLLASPPALATLGPGTDRVSFDALQRRYASASSAQPGMGGHQSQQQAAGYFSRLQGALGLHSQ